MSAVNGGHARTTRWNVPLATLQEKGAKFASLTLATDFHGFIVNCPRFPGHLVLLRGHGHAGELVLAALGDGTAIPGTEAVG